MGYLVISRHKGERILVGDDIEILVSDIDAKKRKIDLAIKAPKSVKITRLPRHIEELEEANRGHKN